MAIAGVRLFAYFMKLITALVSWLLASTGLAMNFGIFKVINTPAYLPGKLGGITVSSTKTLTWFYQNDTGTSGLKAVYSVAHVKPGPYYVWIAGKKQLITVKSGITTTVKY